MSIQSTINQGISIASLLVTQNPAVQAKAEKRHELKGLAKKESALKEQYKQASGKSRPTELGDPEELTLDTFETLTDLPDVERAQKISSELGQVAQSRFEISPSEKTYQAALASEFGEHAGLEKETERVSAFQRLVDASKKADDALAAAQEQRRSGRRVFTQYMADEPLSIGGESFGTFGQLPKNLQKEAAKNYSKKEKTEIMNRKEEQNG